MNTPDEIIRDALDAEVAGVEPSPAGWERLGEKLEGSPPRWKRPLLVALGAAAALLLVVVATVLLRDGDRERVGLEEPITQPTAPPSIVPTTTELPSSTGSTVPPGPTNALPTDFVPISSTWISSANGWVLGRATCATEGCAVIGTTSDGGATWQRVDVNPLPIDPIDLGDESMRTRFVDLENGWIYGQELGLLSTHDGGHSWAPVKIPEVEDPRVVALEGAGGRVSALIARAEGQSPNVYYADSGTDEWTYFVDAVNSASAGVEITGLAVNGDRAFITAMVGEPTVFVTDNAHASDPRPLPAACQQGAHVAPWSPDGLLAVCPAGAAAGSVGKRVFVSTDAGASWTQRLDAPLQGSGFIGAAAGSESTFAVTASSGATMIHMSFDGGGSWSTPVNLGDGGLGFVDIGFTTPQVGVAIYRGGQLYRTTDGGNTWAPVAFN